jgi:hypothetical protein
MATIVRLSKTCAAWKSLIAINPTHRLALIVTVILAKALALYLTPATNQMYPGNVVYSLDLSNRAAIQFSVILNEFES